MVSGIAYYDYHLALATIVATLDWVFQKAPATVLAVAVFGQVYRIFYRVKID